MNGRMIQVFSTALHKVATCRFPLRAQTDFCEKVEKRVFCLLAHLMLYCGQPIQQFDSKKLLSFKKMIVASIFAVVSGLPVY